MRKILLCALAAVCLAGAAPKKPKLLLAIVVDQFRYDYLTRFRSEYKGGLARLLNKGAVFTNGARADRNLGQSEARLYNRSHGFTSLARPRDGEASG